MDFDMSSLDLGSYGNVTSNIDSSVFGALGLFIGAIYGTIVLFGLGILILTMVSRYKICKKANKPGWSVFIPFYSTWVMLEIAGLPGWVQFIPVLNVPLTVVKNYEIARSFGKSKMFSLATSALPWIFLLVLGFNKDEYKGTSFDTLKEDSYKNI